MSWKHRITAAQGHGKVQGPLCKVRDDGVAKWWQKMRLDFNEEEKKKKPKLGYFMDRDFETKKSWEFFSCYFC